MATPRALVVTGHGLNCEAETAAAFTAAGAAATIAHVDDVTGVELAHSQILAIPGGFSYADATGAGNALAQRLRTGLAERLQQFLSRDTLMLGVCNGCQVLVNLGLVGPGREAMTLLPNAGGRYQDRWVHVAADAACASPWVTGLPATPLFVPVAHGEGQFHLAAGALAGLEQAGLVALRYTTPGGAPAAGLFPDNPNGSVADIAGVVDRTGRVLALMPHAERGMWLRQRPDWPALMAQARRRGQTLDEVADGLALYRNAVRWFQ